MNHKQISLLIFFPFTLALALIPLASAQVDIQGGAQTVMDTLSGWGGQLQQFVSNEPVATGAITTLGAGTGIGLGGWAIASKGKKAAEAVANSFKDKLAGAESKAAEATEQLTTYKSQIETSAAQAQTKVTDLQSQLTKSQTSVDTLTQQKTNLQLTVDDLKSQLKTTQDKLSGALAAAQKVI